MYATYYIIRIMGKVNKKSQENITAICNTLTDNI